MCTLPRERAARDIVPSGLLRKARAVGTIGPRFAKVVETQAMVSEHVEGPEKAVDARRRSAAPRIEGSGQGERGDRSRVETKYVIYRHPSQDPYQVR